MGLLFGSGYFNYIAVLKIASGLMLIAGRFVALGLTLLAPILVNILLFHISFDPAGIGMGLAFSVLWLIVFWGNKDSFKGILSPS